MARMARISAVSWMMGTLSISSGMPSSPGMIMPSSTSVASVSPRLRGRVRPAARTPLRGPALTFLERPPLYRARILIHAYLCIRIKYSRSTSHLRCEYVSITYLRPPLRPAPRRPLPRAVLGPTPRPLQPRPRPPLTRRPSSSYSSTSVGAGFGQGCHAVCNTIVLMNRGANQVTTQQHPTATACTPVKHRAKQHRSNTGSNNTGQTTTVKHRVKSQTPTFFIALFIALHRCSGPASMGHPVLRLGRELGPCPRELLLQKLGLQLRLRVGDTCILCATASTKMRAHVVTQAEHNQVAHTCACRIWSIWSLDSS